MLDKNAALKDIRNEVHHKISIFGSNSIFKNLFLGGLIFLNTKFLKLQMEALNESPLWLFLALAFTVFSRQCMISTSIEQSGFLFGK